MPAWLKWRVLPPAQGIAPALASSPACPKIGLCAHLRRTWMCFSAVQAHGDADQPRRGWLGLGEPHGLQQADAQQRSQTFKPCISVDLPANGFDAYSGQRHT